MFDAIAGRYDLLNHLLSAGIDRRWRKRAIQALSLTGRERVLDLCTGTADLAITAIQAQPPAARVVGVDFAQAMLRVGQEKIRQGGWSIALPSCAAMRRAFRSPTAPSTPSRSDLAFATSRTPPRRATRCAACSRQAAASRFSSLRFRRRPACGALYLWYFNHVLPLIGRLISRHTAAYGYLPASVGAFASP